jgi:hypothetical protein
VAVFFENSEINIEHAKYGKSSKARTSKPSPAVFRLNIFKAALSMNNYDIEVNLEDFENDKNGDNFDNCRFLQNSLL